MSLLKRVRRGAATWVENRLAQLVKLTLIGNQFSALKRMCSIASSCVSAAPMRT